MTENLDPCLRKRLAQRTDHRQSDNKVPNGTPSHDQQTIDGHTVILLPSRLNGFAIWRAYL
jgi:hypothetical protein